MTERQIVDFQRLAERLDQTANLPRLLPQLKQARLLQSCISDLKQAQSNMNALHSLQTSFRRTGTVERLATENSLIFMSVVLYARATATNGGLGERGSSAIASNLSDEDASDHRAIVDFRNRVVSHVYMGEANFGVVWNEQAPFYVETSNGFKLTIATRSGQSSKVLVKTLGRLIPRAMAILQHRMNKTIDRIVAMIKGHVTYELINEFKCDPITFFEGRDRVDAAFGGIDSSDGAIVL